MATDADLINRAAAIGRYTAEYDAREIDSNAARAYMETDGDGYESPNLDMARLAHELDALDADDDALHAAYDAWRDAYRAVMFATARAVLTTTADLRLISARLQGGSTYNQEWHDVALLDGYYSSPLHALLDLAREQADGSEWDAQWITAIESAIAAGETTDLTTPDGVEYRYLFA